MPDKFHVMESSSTVARISAAWAIASRSLGTWQDTSRGDRQKPDHPLGKEAEGAELSTTVGLGNRLGIETSRNTTLRRIMDVPDEARASVVYLGIDDFSFRRGYRFGTILVDLESHRPIDVLPDRRAETSAEWIRDNPEIQVVSRDRGSEYASAATQGAPQAIQVADRFHICKNLTEATQLLLARCQVEIAAASKTEEPAQNEGDQLMISIEEWRPKEPAHVKKVRLTRRAGREARYEQAMKRHEQGLSAKEIAYQLGMSQRTVQKWLAAGTFPEAKKRRKKHSSFDTFAPYVLKRWQQGERKGLTLWREIQQQGYTGSERTVYRHIETLKQASVQAARGSNRLHTFTASTAVWLFVRDPKSLDEVEQEDLATFCQASPTLKRAYDLVQDFMQIVHKREGHRLDTWLGRIATSESSRTSAICGWGGERQSRSESWLNLVHEQWAS